MLTERYGLYTTIRRGVPYRLEFHHPLWPAETPLLHVAPAPGPCRLSLGRITEG